MTNTNEDNGVKLFCLGMGIGVVTAFLLTPKSGDDTRRFIRDKADESADLIKRQSQEIADRASGLVERGAKAVRHQKESLKAAVEAGQQAFRNGAATPAERDYQL